MKSVRIGVVPAAGPGRRLGYLSSILPKSLFPLLDRPIIHHVIDNFQKINVKTVFVIVGFQRDRIEEYFKNVSDSIDVELNFVTQEKLTGIADAIGLAEQHIDEPFACILGDDITTGSLRGLPEFFLEKEATAVQATVEEPNLNILRNTCCLKLDRSGKITRLTEKPRMPFSNLRGCGVYVFHNSIFDHIRRTPPSSKRGEKEITDVIGRVAVEGRAFGWLLKGRNFNVNTYEDLFAAWQEVQRERRTERYRPYRQHRTVELQRPSVC